MFKALDDDKDVPHGASNELQSIPGNAVKSETKSDQASLSVFSGGIRTASPDPSLISIDDSNNIRLGRNPDYLPVPDGRTVRHASSSPAPPARTLKGKVRLFWTRNKGLALVMVSQMFGMYYHDTNIKLCCCTTFLAKRFCSNTVLSY